MRDPECLAREPHGGMRPSDWLLALVVFGIQLGFFLFLAFQRIADSDEGFYLYASKVVFGGGAVLYRDIFYPQMPLLPFVYGGWMRLTGCDWQSARALSAILAALTGTILFQYVRASTGRTILAACALLFYMFNLSVMLFYLTAKTYVPSVAFLFAGLMLAGSENGRFGRWAPVAAGLFVALSIQTRLYFIVTAPVIALLFWKRRSEKPNRFPLLFCGGFVAGSIPSLIFLSLAPSQFVFDNLLYHSVRNSSRLIAEFPQKLEVLKQLFLTMPGLRPTQFSLLSAGIVSGLFFWNRLSRLAKASVAVSIALGAVSLLPTPAFGQYFCVLVPFLVISLVESAGVLIRLLPNRSLHRAVECSLLLVALAYAGWSISKVDPYFINGEAAPGLDADTRPLDWKIATIEKVANIVEMNTHSNALVVSVWPGYLVTANRKAYPGMENQFALDSAMRISSEDAARYRMMREDGVAAAIADQDTEAVIIGNWAHTRVTAYKAALDSNSYHSVGRIGNAEVFARSWLQTRLDQEPQDSSLSDISVGGKQM